MRAVTRDRAVSTLLATAFLAAVALDATALPQPLRALAWAAFAACVVVVLVCLWVLTGTDRRVIR